MFWDNERGLWIEDGWELDSEWYEDDNGLLYIVPPAGCYSEIIGPNTATFDDLADMLCDHGEVTDEDLEQLHLAHIPDAQKRFDAFSGLFHA